jgi:insertion element IS1 protein InsB
MTCIAVRCPHCQSDPSGKRGKTARGPQRSLCPNTLCVRGSCLLDSGKRGCLPDVKPTLIDMRRHARGGRETARSLPRCPNPVRRARTKKATARESVPPALWRTLHPAEVAWDVERAGEAEAERDARWSLVGHPGPPRWLWQAIAPYTGKGVADGFGRRQADVVVQLQALLEPCGLTRSSTDSWGASPRHLEPDVPWPGTRHPQKIERQPLTLRTRSKRVVRKTLCCSQTTPMQASVLGLLVNR